MKKLFITVLLFAAFTANAQDPAYPPAPAAPLNVVKAEYFIDADPGFGLGTDIPFTAATNIPALAATINTAALSAGAHKLYVRTLNAEGKWSVTTVRQFVIDFDPAYPTNTAPLNVVKAEYFIDTDPGFGLGTDIPVTAALDIPALAGSINTASLLAGAHRLYVRTLNAEGEWSITTTRQFTVDFDPAYPATPASPQNITSAEYFIDTDPGFGNGTNIPLTAAVDIAALVANVNTNLLPAGAHRLYIRTSNNEGKWSVTTISQFIVNDDPAYPAAPAAPGNITSAEYFFDTDPGFGNGTSITLTPGVDISNLTFAANTAALSAGTHNLYIRSLDDWSITNVTPFNVDAVLPLRFISFTAAKADDKVLLSWKTADEQNTSHFDIERSSDGIIFEKIATTAAANSNGQHNYQQKDHQPHKGINYYRIKQVDKDGRFTYSAVIRISFNNNQKLLTVYPNPATQFVFIDCAALQGKVQVNIFDMQGRLVLSEQKTNTTLIKINIEKLAAGKYTVITSTGQQFETDIFIKQ